MRITLTGVNGTLPLAGATRQQVFEQAVRHCLTQGRRALSLSGPGHVCQYRAEDGTACAFGCFITPEEYKPGMEGRHIIDVLRIADCEIPNSIYVLCGELQGVHDEHGPETWKSVFKDRGRELKLDIEFIDKEFPDAN